MSSVDINSLEGWLVKKKNRLLAEPNTTPLFYDIINSKKVFGSDVRRWFKIEKVTGEVYLECVSSLGSF